MSSLLAILALVATTPANVTATKLDGTTVSGQLQAWQSERLELATSSGTYEIAEADLVLLQFSPASAGGPRQPVVELVDGTQLPLADFGIRGSDALLTLRRPVPAETQEVAVPLRQVRAVRLQPLEEAAMPQWREIRELKAAGDLLVLLKRGGQSLDYLEGVIGKFAEKDVEFTLDDKSVRVPREKVAGMIYYRSDPPSDEPPRCVLTGRDELRIAASSVRLAGDELQITTRAGLDLAWPLAGLHAADFSAGKVVYLSDLKPAAHHWRPLVGLPNAAAHAAQFGPLRVDRSATGGPLTLQYRAHERDAEPGRMESFARGLALRSRTDLVYRLPQGFGRFLAVAGIEPTTSDSGHVMLSIFGDDRVLAEFPVAGHDAPLPIELDIAGVRRLRIVVDYGQNLDTGDWLNLCNARIVK